MKLVSIVVPVYNTEGYIRNCIDSLLRQTYDNIEIIIVNDGSTDNSDIICQEYMKADNRIKYFRQNNMGPGVARNEGIRRSTGDFIMFVDSDDWLDNDCVDYMVRMIQGHDIVQVGTHVYSSDGIGLRFDESNELLIDQYYSNYSICLNLLCGKYKSGGVPWGKLFARKLFSDISFPALYRFEDVATMYKLFWKATNGIVIDDAAKYCYRSERKNSLMHSGYTIDWLKILDVEKERICFFESEGEWGLSDLARYNYCNQIYYNYRRVKNDLKDEKVLLDSLKKTLKEELPRLNKTKYWVKYTKTWIKYILM